MRNEAREKVGWAESEEDFELLVQGLVSGAEEFCLHGELAVCPELVDEVDIAVAAFAEQADDLELVDYGPGVESLGKHFIGHFCDPIQWADLRDCAFKKCWRLEVR